MMAGINNDLCLMAVLSVIYVKQKRRRDQLLKKKTIRSKWVKSWLSKRSRYSHINLMEELRLEPDDFRNYLRMDEDTYVELLTMVSPLIEKQDTRMRKSISAHERLSATLRFLATGRSFEDLKYTALVSPQALGKIIPETCKAICKVLHKEYVNFPNSEREWLTVANDFFTKWNFPCCLGAVDGKHVRIACPPKSGSFFFNYKGYFSMVLMAIVNANYEFILVDIGTNGRVSDGGVIENTGFYEKLKMNALKIPLPTKSYNSSEELPFVFIGDEAFALLPNFMKPFNMNVLDNRKKIFNYRLSRARNVVENGFGILASRFRIFHTEINLQLHNIELAVLASVSIHNFLRKKLKDRYVCRDVNSFDDAIQNVTERVEAFGSLQRGPNRNASEEAKSIREKFSSYFNNEGQVTWQQNRVS